MISRTARIAVVIAAALAAGGVFALDPGVSSSGLPTAPDFSAQLLPERAGVVSWKTLAEVEPVKQGDKIVPRYAKAILALDSRDQRVQGFMIPLDLGDRQKHFLLSAVPPHCSFCLPAGPEAIVEVMAKEPVAYSIDPIVVSGRFAVLKDDSDGVLYRLQDAKQTDVVKLAPGLPPGFAVRAPN